jgi:superfamily II DNA or RNA helicase
VEGAVAAASERVRSGEFDPLHALLARLAHEKLMRPDAGVLYSLHSAAATFLPYQFRPVLKLVSQRAGGLLIADEVGLGKTIEAGYVLKELKARRRGDFQRALIVCPSTLRAKWREEMARRFGERFDVLDADGLRSLIDRISRGRGDSAFQAIVSRESLRSKHCRDRLESLWPIDLVVFDEAHHLRNPGTKIHAAAVKLRNASREMVLLSATPIQMHADNLRVLLSLIAPDRVMEQAGFDAQMAANQQLVEAERQVASATAAGDAQAQELLGALMDGGEMGVLRSDLEVLRRRIGELAGARSPAVRLAIAREIREAGPFSTLLTRTRRREVNISYCDRQAMVVPVDLTADERTVYDWCLAEARRLYAEAGIGEAAKQAGTAFQRQFASSLRAHLPQLVAAPEVEDGDPGLRHGPQHIADAAARLEAGGVDSKYDRMIEAMRGIIENDPSAKFVVFAFYKATLKYLEARLKRDRLPCVRIDGGVASRPERPTQDLRGIRIRRFKVDPGVRVLLSSQVGSEGLDFQDVAHVVVNYDLPWNPMQVEQRIGRVDRLGQRKREVIVMNFTVRNTVEDRVLLRLLERTNIFRQSIGDHDEILGDVVEGDIREILMRSDITDSERERMATEAGNRTEDRINAARAADAPPDMLVGADSVIDAEVREIESSLRRVMPAELATFVETALKRSGLQVLPGHAPRRTAISEPGRLANVVCRHLNGRDERFFRELVGGQVDAGQFVLQYEDPLQPMHVHVGHPVVTAAIGILKQAREVRSSEAARIDLAACAICRLPDLLPGVHGLGIFALTARVDGSEAHRIDYIAVGPDCLPLGADAVSRLVGALHCADADARGSAEQSVLSDALVEAINGLAATRAATAQSESAQRMARRGELRYAKDRARIVRELEAARARIGEHGFGDRAARYRTMIQTMAVKAEAALEALDNEHRSPAPPHVTSVALGYVAIRNMPSP